MPQTVKRVSRSVGLPERTIRYYDAVALVSPRQRSAAGYRLYDRGDEAKLAFVQQARRLGYSLDEIRTLIAAAERHVVGQLDAEIAGLEARIAELADFRERLLAYRSASGSACGCRGHRAFCGCQERGSETAKGGENMCNCCAPSREKETSAAEAQDERSDEAALKQRVADLEKRLEKLQPTATR